MRLRKTLIVFAVSLFFLVSLVAGYQSASANSATKQASPLVDTKWLEDNLNNAKVKVIFVDNWPSDKDEFMKKHIKGSYYMGIGALMGTIGNGSAAPDREQFKGMMTRLGISNGDHVVVYGATGDRVFTLGALWLMQYFGHVNVSFLDGGLAKWNKEGRPTEGGMQAAEPGNYTVGAANEAIRVDGAYVHKNLKNAATVLVDARGHGEYIGEVNNDNNKRVGRIPGALDLGYKVTNFKEDGTLKSVDDLKKAYEAQGVTNDKEVITYCQGGIKAANAYYALKHILGYDNVKVYVGSWGEWANRTDYPIEK